MSTAVRRAIYGRLSSDSTLGNLLATAPTGYTKSIYHDFAPDNALFPYVLFHKQSGVPNPAFGTEAAAMEEDVWLVKGVDKNASADTVEAIQSRVQSLLSDSTLSISGATHLYLRRQSDVEFPEVYEGDTYRHAGALYRLVYD